MYVKSVSIRNFKTIQRLDIDLDDGFNTIYGSNETGKSTFLEALTAAFFVKADSGSSEVAAFRSWQSEADPEVRVIFVAGNNEYLLEKKFLGARRGRLSCPARGLETTNKDKIDEELAQLLPFGVLSEDALTRTFWIPQREIEQTIDTVHDDLDIRAALRHAIVMADGDIEAIKSSVESKIKELGKGALRHAQQPGPLKQAELAKARLEADLREMQQKLADLDKNIARRKELSEQVDSLREQIEDDESLLLAAEEYNKAQGALALANKNFDALQEAVESYENGQKELVALSPILAELERNLGEINILMKGVVAQAEIQKIDEKLQADRLILSSVENIEARIAALQAGKDLSRRIPKSDVDSARNLDRAIDTKRASLKSAQLSVEARGISDSEIIIAEDGSPLHPETFAKNESKTFAANRKFDLTLPGVLQLSISSGVKSAVELQKELDVARQSLANLLSKHAALSLDDLVKRYEAEQSLFGALANLENEKKGMLRGQTLEATKASIRSLEVRKEKLAAEIVGGPSQASEPIDVLTAQRDRIVSDKANLAAGMKQLELASQRFMQTHKSVDEAKVMRRGLAKEIAKVEALLEGIHKVEMSDEQLYLRKRKLQQSKTEYESLRTELLTLTGALQAASVSSDMWNLKEAEYEEAKADYEANLLEYDAYQLLLATLNEAEAAVTQHLSDPVRIIVATLLPRLTLGRYAEVQLDETLKMVSARFRDFDVNPDDLSTGAKGQLALAIRLALIEQLSGKDRQMVVIDDALVYFDAARLAEAKSLLTDFSQKHQIVYLTCHNEMKEGNIIELVQ